MDSNRIQTWTICWRSHSTDLFECLYRDISTETILLYRNIVETSFTFWSHICRKTFCKTTSLTLISSWNIDNAFSSFFTCVFQISAEMEPNKMKLFLFSFGFCVLHLICGWNILNSPSNAAFEESTTPVARWNTVVFSRCSISTHFAMVIYAMNWTESRFLFRHRTFSYRLPFLKWTQIQRDIVIYTMQRKNVLIFKIYNDLPEWR